MRITKQSSGGRGEYEIAEYAPNGLKPTDLLNCPISVKIDNFIVNTGICLRNSQGKNRLRRIDGQGGYPQIQLQTASILLLPKPIREEDRLEGGSIVLQDDGYIIKNIHFGEVEKRDDNTILAEVRTIDCANGTQQAEQVTASQRMREIMRIWEKAESFPDQILSLLRQHEQVVCLGQPIPTTASKIVEDLQRNMEPYCNDLEIPYSRRMDVLPALISALNGVVDLSPIPLEEVDPQQEELRRRIVDQWRRFANSRGSASVSFKKAVQQAYNYTCVICGLRFPPTEFNRNPGVDAAHILPWSAYDLDKVYNGLALCKLHHWSFDEGIHRIVHRNDRYFVEMPDEAFSILSKASCSVEKLKEVLGEIPSNRLPITHSNWPRPELLQKLGEDLL